MDSLRAHTSSGRSISIHNSTNAILLWINMIDSWLKLGDGEEKGEKRKERTENRMLPLFTEENYQDHQ